MASTIICLFDGMFGGVRSLWGILEPTRDPLQVNGCCLHQKLMFELMFVGCARVDLLSEDQDEDCCVSDAEHLLQVGHQRWFVQAKEVNSNWSGVYLIVRVLRFTRGSKLNLEV